MEPLDPTFDITGWRSSYTGEPIADAEMRQWVDSTVGRVLSLAPRRILEVGCGTGLLLHQLAPLVSHYSAVDFSSAAIASLQEAVRAKGLTNVTLKVSQADTAFAGVGLAPVDLVIINSVVQYFPDVEYLIRVLEQAVAAVAPGGAVFVGDVRDLSLLEAFHTSVEVAQAPAGMSTDELRRRVHDRVQHDPELVIAHAFFSAIAARLEGVTDVDVQLKRGRTHNEMTSFRYDVVLRVGGSLSGDAPSEIDGRGLSLDDVRAVVAASTGAVTVRGIGNPRLTASLEAVRLLSVADGPDTVAALRSQPQTTTPAIDPEDLSADAVGCDVDIRPSASGAAGEYDATFRSAGVSRRGSPPVLERGRSWGSFVHQPLADRGQLVHALKQHLRSRVPPYMVPAAFVLLESLPLTPNGKIDRNALPEPDQQRQAASAYVAPSSDIERLVAETWRELLALDRIGTHDNFFDIGANSLLMVRAHEMLRERLGHPVSLVDLFRFPTISSLAGFLGRPTEGAAPDALIASETRAQARNEALRRRRQGRPSARAGSLAEDPRHG